jgi:hypothetical protein
MKALWKSSKPYFRLNEEKKCETPQVNNNDPMETTDPQNIANDASTAPIDFKASSSTFPIHEHSQENAGNENPVFRVTGRREGNNFTYFFESFNPINKETKHINLLKLRATLVTES